MKLSANDKRAIVNRYWAHPKNWERGTGGDRYCEGLALEYSVGVATIYRTLQNAHFTHYEYCSHCLSSVIHQRWCDRTK